MEITEAEFATYNQFTNLPPQGMRIRILACIHAARPIRRFRLYEGTVNSVIQEGWSNQIILNPGATETIVHDGAVTNGAAPLTNGRIIFPIDVFDFSSYYWKEIRQPADSEIVYKKYRPVDSIQIVKPIELNFESDVEPEPIKLVAGKSKRKNKKKRKTKRKSLK